MITLAVRRRPDPVGVLAARVGIVAAEDRHCSRRRHRVLSGKRPHRSARSNPAPQRPARCVSTAGAADSAGRASQQYHHSNNIDPMGREYARNTPAPMRRRQACVPQASDLQAVSMALDAGLALLDEGFPLPCGQQSGRSADRRVASAWNRLPVTSSRQSESTLRCRPASPNGPFTATFAGSCASASMSTYNTTCTCEVASLVRAKHSEDAVELHAFTAPSM